MRDGEGSILPITMTCRITGCCHGAGGSENRLPQATYLSTVFIFQKEEKDDEEEMEERKEITMMMMMDDDG